MAKIITKLAYDAYDIKQQFAIKSRDYYPMAVYEFIFNSLKMVNTTYTELDVVEWCSSIDIVTLNEACTMYNMQLETIDELADYSFKKKSSIIAIDQANQKIYLI